MFQNILQDLHLKIKWKSLKSKEIIFVDKRVYKKIIC